MSLTPERTAELQELCRQYRIDVLTAIHGAQSGHPGGSLSVCEILTLLYQQRMHVDAAHPDPVSQVQAVRAVIDTIEGASDIPELIALNKADLASPEQIALLRTVYPGAVPLSAHTGWGVDALRAALEDMLPRPRVAIDVILPYSAGSLVHRIHEEGEVDREEYVETGTRIVARVDEALAALIAREAVGGTVGDPAGSGQ